MLNLIHEATKKLDLAHFTVAMPKEVCLQGRV